MRAVAGALFLFAFAHTQAEPSEVSPPIHRRLVPPDAQYTHTDREISSQRQPTKLGTDTVEEMKGGVIRPAVSLSRAGACPSLCPPSPGDDGLPKFPF